MSALDTGSALQLLKDVTGMSNHELGTMVGKTHDYINRYLSLVAQPEAIKELLRPGRQSSDNAPITIKHVIETKEVLQNDADKIAVLEKAASEGLTAQQTRRVAQSIKQAPTEQAKKRLLDWEYSPTIHNPEWIEERREQFGAHDPLYHGNALSPQRQWDDAPEIKAILDYFKSIKEYLDTKYDRAIELGKLDPSGYSFMVARLRNLSYEFNKRVKQLEDNNGDTKRN